ncbi:hypothetical protein [Pleomorphomonas carboxyditropha]|uniref:hypothetical protein n=1 Tax=Pleomorphomonas carboxyditropha TaxID=2023338 RepID=UPI0013FD4BAB|nr:hypothetical protein [Pleomorphomonas carboxyditropha]
MLARVSHLQGEICPMQDSRHENRCRLHDGLAGSNGDQGSAMAENRQLPAFRPEQVTG